MLTLKLRLLPFTYLLDVFQSASVGHLWMLLQKISAAVPLHTRLDADEC